MFKLTQKNALEYYVSDIFPESFRHAFTTRKGGFAPPPLDSFSMGTAQYGHLKESVLKNRELICKELSINFKTLLMTDQHHTDNIAVITEENTYNQGYIPHTDAVILARKNQGAMLFFADCIPVALYDTQNNIAALIHAGWRGTASQIAPKTLKKMISEFNTIPENTVAAIGPGIGICCYCVSPDVAESLLETLPPHLISDKIISDNHQPRVDLKEINSAQLKNSGIKYIDIIDQCTSCNQIHFFSHRATNGQTGRHSLIAQVL
jgi:hypothetical protein